jgi:membrane protein implicated in regulation of membrane protease activity
LIHGVLAVEVAVLALLALLLPLQLARHYAWINWLIVVVYLLYVGVNFVSRKAPRKSKKDIFLRTGVCLGGRSAFVGDGHPAVRKRHHDRYDGPKVPRTVLDLVIFILAHQLPW